MPESADPDPEALLDAIRSFVAQWFRDGREDGLEADTPLVTSGIVDSAGVVEIVEFVERRFGVRLQDHDLSLRNCNTLAGWTALVAERLGGRVAGA
ncbi:MAG: acyl carrier protein [Planctomycetes bacterium]|nr:acyl carrier protein [Planctomycetota bacterium]